MKINLSKIPEVTGHLNTVYKKQLITLGEKKGSIATFNYARLAKGMKLNPHTHPDGEEYYLFLDGEGKMLLGNEWMDVEKGDFITVTQDQIHSLINENENDLIFITLRTVF